MDSAMNEEVNYCNQCGVKISSDAKFCSNCGHDLKNSSTKITSDKTIKVEVTNVTVEKGFKAIGKGLKKVFKTKEKTWLDTPSQKRLERQAPQHDEPEMITDVKIVLIVFAVLFLFIFAIGLFEF